MLLFSFFLFFFLLFPFPPPPPSLSLSLMNYCTPSFLRLLTSLRLKVSLGCWRAWFRENMFLVDIFKVQHAIKWF